MGKFYFSNKKINANLCIRKEFSFFIQGKFFWGLPIKFIFIYVVTLVAYHIESDNFIFTDICDNFCQNGGTCSVESGKQKCYCPDDFEGNKCEKSRYII